MPIYGENMQIFQKVAENYLSNFLKYNIAIADVFLPKNSLTGAKNSLKCESNLFLPLLILMKTMGPEIEFLSKSTSEMVIFFKFESFFFCYFLTKIHIFAIYRHLKEVVS